MQKKNRKQPTRVSLQLSKGRSCILCGREDETIVPAHYQGIGSHELGKGMGSKPHDIATADLCMCCHDALDGRSNDLNHLTKFERSNEFLLAIVKTMIRDFENGNLVYKK